MSVIEDALRRAQAQNHAAAPQTPQPVVAGARPAAAAPANVRRANRRSPATPILAGLAVAVVILLRQPGWIGEIATTAQPAGMTAPASSVERVTIMPQALTGSPQTMDIPPMGPEIGDIFMPTETPAQTRGESQVPALVQLDNPNAPVAEERIDPAPAARTDAAKSPAFPPAGALAAREIAEKLQLSGIMLSGSHRMAIINGVIVGEGQIIDGALVKSVSRRSVTLEVAGQTVQLPMLGAGN